MVAIFCIIQHFTSQASAHKVLWSTQDILRDELEKSKKIVLDPFGQATTFIIIILRL